LLHSESVPHALLIKLLPVWVALLISVLPVAVANKSRSEFLGARAR
jgi:hypothetical protein